ncbi:MAG: large conductance mechanosensitive channel protein MscL [Bacilli bacterium]|nr:large conductance mechanosensitive channel protein MscL [Bacilli bacterium]
MIKEFKEFISRGNVVDLAVGVIIGGAFTAIVTALTGQILQPVINWLISLGGGGSLDDARTILGEEVFILDTTTGLPVINPVTGLRSTDWSKTNYIDWGAFISAIINFILIAIILFAFVKLVNKFREKEEMVKAKVAKKDKEEK